MKINDELFPKIMESVKETLLSSSSSTNRKKNTNIVKFLHVLSTAEQEFIVKEILHSQNKSIIQAMENKRNITLPKLGCFKYRKTSEVNRELFAKVKAKYHIDQLKDADPVIAELALDELHKLQREILIPIAIAEVNNREGKINYNFLNKTKNESST
jgi:nucleoid DNA-binding protein